MGRFALRGGILCALLLLPGCRRFAFDEEVRVRQQEIHDLEDRLHLKQNSPIYSEKFDPLLEDEDASIPHIIYQHIIRRLSALSHEEIGGRVDTEITYEKLTDTPADFRGRFVRLSGRIANIWPETLKVDGRTRRVYGGVIFVEDRFPLLFHVLEKPEVLYEKEDWVGLDGLFVKVMRYELKDGARMRAPFVVGRRLLKYH